MELLSKDLDKLAEIDTTIGNIVEYRLNLIALILNIANLHIQAHIGSDLARANHCFVFEGDGLLPLLDIVRASLAVNLLKLAILRIEAKTLHLACHHIARKRDDTYIVTGRSLYCHNIAHLQLQVVDILIEGTASILKSYLKNIGRKVVGVFTEPRLLVQTKAATSLSCIGLSRLIYAKGNATTNFGFIIFCIIHNFAKVNILRKDTNKN